MFALLISVCFTKYLLSVCIVGCVFYSGTDISCHAARAAMATGVQNNSAVDIVQTDLVSTPLSKLCICWTWSGEQNGVILQLVFSACGHCGGMPYCQFLVRLS